MKNGGIKWLTKHVVSKQRTKTEDNRQINKGKVE